MAELLLAWEKRLFSWQASCPVCRPSSEEPSPIYAECLPVSFENDWAKCNPVLCWFLVLRHKSEISWEDTRVWGLWRMTNDRPQDYLLNKVFLKREPFPASKAPGLCDYAWTCICKPSCSWGFVDVTNGAWVPDGKPLCFNQLKMGKMSSGVKVYTHAHNPL